MKDRDIPIEVSRRHVHLSEEHVEALFGKDYTLQLARALSQPGQFAAEERVHLYHGEKVIENVRVVGPERSDTQVELSETDANHLEIDAPRRLSGNIHETPGLTLKGPEGSIILEKGVIIAQRHLHLSPEESELANLKHGDITKVKINNLVLEDLHVRVGHGHSLAVHIDEDEQKHHNLERNSKGRLHV